jgi:hypothetical protein
MIHRDHRHGVQEKSPALDAEVEAVSSERFELLTRKHGGGIFTSQDQERLDSLDGRIQQLVPRVTEGDLRNLKEFERRLDEREERLREIRRKYGLDETV